MNYENLRFIWLKVAGPRWRLLQFALIQLIHDTNNFDPLSLLFRLLDKTCNFVIQRPRDTLINASSSDHDLLDLLNLLLLCALLRLLLHHKRLPLELKRHRHKHKQRSRGQHPRRISRSMRVARNRHCQKIQSRYTGNTLRAPREAQCPAALEHAQGQSRWQLHPQCLRTACRRRPLVSQPFAQKNSWNSNQKQVDSEYLGKMLLDLAELLLD